MKCECRHDGNTYSDVFCSACGKGYCKDCINTHHPQNDIEAKVEEMKDYDENVGWVCWPDDVKKVLTEQATQQAMEKAEYEAVFKWLMGELGDFPDLSQRPHYTFRPILRSKLQTIKEKYSTQPKD